MGTSGGITSRITSRINSEINREYIFVQAEEAAVMSQSTTLTFK